MSTALVSLEEYVETAYSPDREFVDGAIVDGEMCGRPRRNSAHPREGAPPAQSGQEREKQHDNDLDAFRGQGAVHFEQHAGIQGSDSQTTGRLRDVQSSTRA